MDASVLNSKDLCFGDVPSAIVNVGVCVAQVSVLGVSERG